MIYLSGVIIVILVLVYDAIYNREGLKDNDDGELLLLSLLIIVVVLCSWISIILFGVAIGLKYLRDKE